jgi:hypothetical protein
VRHALAAGELHIAAVPESTFTDTAVISVPISNTVVHHPGSSAAGVGNGRASAAKRFHQM